MTGVLVGVDIGTTRVKAVATDPDLTARGEHAVVTPWRHEGANADIDPFALAQAVSAAAAGAAEAAGARALAVGIAGMSETGVLLDRHDAPLAPALAWHDPRGDCDLVRSELGDEAYRSIAGRPINAVSSLPKLLWLRRHVAAARQA
ncbi:MAG: FGGY family carbohydrate kinase, partial [Sporichthyaceae bacterium]